MVRAEDLITLIIYDGGDNMLLSTAHSILTALEHPIDSRQLTLSCHFFGLSQEERLCFSLKAQQWIQINLLKNAQGCWKVNEKQTSLRNLEKRIQEAGTCSSMISWDVQAFINSPWVYNQSTCRDVLKKLKLLSAPTTADDFKAYWDSVFPDGRCDNDSLLAGIHQIFRENNRVLKTSFPRPDVVAFFCSNPSRTHCGKHDGSLAISIPAVILAENLSNIADEFLTLLKSWSLAFCGVNGFVMLQPYHFPIGSSPYMHYFGQYYLGEDFCEDRNENLQRWYERYYLTGVEWANLLSPLVMERLRKCTPFPTCKSGMQIECLDNGAALVKSSKKINQYCVEDAILLKEHLLPAIYPGGSYQSLTELFCEEIHNLSCRPRADWAIVPILNGEIKIIGTDLVFRTRTYLI